MPAQEPFYRVGAAWPADVFTDAGSIADGGRFLADLLTVAPGIRAQRVRVDGRVVDSCVLNVVGHGSLRWIKASHVPYPFGNLVVSARRITTHAETADDAPVLVHRQSATKYNSATTDLHILRGVETLGVERFGLHRSEQGMAGLSKRIQAGRGHRRRVRTEAICRERFGHGDAPAARPVAASRIARSDNGADLSFAIDGRGPFGAAAEKPACFTGIRGPLEQRGDVARLGKGRAVGGGFGACTVVRRCIRSPAGRTGRDEQRGGDR